jgi:hypothetical protein
MSNRKNVNYTPVAPKKSSGTIGSAIDKILGLIRTELENPADQVAVLNTVVHVLGLKGTIVRAFQPAPEESLISTIQRLGVASSFQRMPMQAPKGQQDPNKAMSGSRPGNPDLAKAGDARPTTSNKRARKTESPRQPSVPFLERRMSKQQREELEEKIQREKLLSTSIGERLAKLIEQTANSKGTGPKPALPKDDAEIAELKECRKWIKNFRIASKDYPRDPSLSKTGGLKAAPAKSGESGAKKQRTDTRQSDEEGMESTSD